ncbi:MAG: DUF6973 domain-containing protein [Bacteroidia bacterium]
MSRPEKVWVFFHPFVSKKSFQLTKQILSEVDSIKKTGIIGTDNNGGRLDAFKHAYWMASLSNKIGSKKALKLGKAHEKGNYLQFKKHLPEDNILPDSVSSVMDLKNNEVGAAWGRGEKNTAQAKILKIILDGLNEGKLNVIKKDAAGNFLTCDGAIIIMKEWLGRWGIPKCLENSIKD